MVLKYIKRVIVSLFVVAMILIPTAQVNTSKAAADTIVSKAYSKIGAKYARGAAHSMGQIANPNQSRFDCSGFVNWVAYQSGHSVGSKTSSSYSGVGRSVSKKAKQAGDILVFRSHVGIYIGSNKFIHAPRPGKRVSVSSLSKSWNRKLKTVRRIA